MYQNRSKINNFRNNLNEEDDSIEHQDIEDTPAQNKQRKKGASKHKPDICISNKTVPSKKSSKNKEPDLQISITSRSKAKQENSQNKGSPSKNSHGLSQHSENSKGNKKSPRSSKSSMSNISKKNPSSTVSEKSS